MARRADGRIDVSGWVEDLAARYPRIAAGPVMDACGLVGRLADRSETHLERGIELAELVAELRLDTASVCAALAYRPVRAGVLSTDQVREVLGADVVHLVEEVLRMASASLLEMNNSRLQTTQRRDQADNVRRMLIAMIDDARVAVLKLSERVVALRAAKHDDEARKQRIGREAHLVFAPLANRLGIWQLKWELEDLALRYLAPDIYVSIARQLDGRRAERERQVA
ncbi:MAG: HD domain-containing protein, partial [Pseudomonadales bacterium]